MMLRYLRSTSLKNAGYFIFEAISYSVPGSISAAENPMPDLVAHSGQSTYISCWIRFTVRTVLRRGSPSSIPLLVAAAIVPGTWKPTWIMVVAAAPLVILILLIRHLLFRNNPDGRPATRLGREMFPGDVFVVGGLTKGGFAVGWSIERHLRRQSCGRTTRPWVPVLRFMLQRITRRSRGNGLTHGVQLARLDVM